MTAFAPSDFVEVWVGKLQTASTLYPDAPFDDRTALPMWLASGARDQAERVFLVLDATPVERRDLGAAEIFIYGAGMAFLEAWGQAMAAFHTDAESWAAEAAEAAVETYHMRLNELAPALHAGGVA